MVRVLPVLCTVLALLTACSGGGDAPAPGATERADAAETGESAIAPPTPAEPNGRPPNVILFLADDLGWADTTLSGSRFYETPNLERLARGGTRFSAAYTTPVCQPTRAGLLTGRYPGARLKIVGGKVSREPGVPESDDPEHRLVRPERLPALMAGEVTLAESIRAAGYTTWFAGKWDLGGMRQGPAPQGFDRVLEVGGRATRSHVAPYRNAGLELRGDPDGKYLADSLTDVVIDWLHWERGHRPFFLYLAHHSVHSPWQAKPLLLKKYRLKAAGLRPSAPQRHPVMAAMIESLDESLGRILDTLEELGIVDETIVIFMSDNGGVIDEYQGVPISSNAPLGGAKGSTREGGIRVPLIVRWPGVARPGAVADAPVSHVDIQPTLLAAVGAEPPADTVIDGVDLRPLLTGESDERSGPIFLHFPLHEFSSVVRQGRWKLIRYYASEPDGEARDQLYDLEADIGETRDLAPSEPERAAELGRLLDQWLAETGALLPVPNPAYGGPSGRG
jgi:arylsulfatase A-like enzyme